MKLSTRARYGTRALLDLAIHFQNEPVPLKDIARRQDISLHYLEHLMAPLIDAEIIRSHRGARGGLRLVRHPREIKLSEVVPLLEGKIAPVACVINAESCPRGDTCATRLLWSEMKKAIDGVLEAMTLQDLVEQEVKQVKKEPQKRAGHPA